MVVEAGRVPAKAAQRTKELLQTVQAPVAGFVLNDRTSFFSDTYGYYRKGYYGYANYGTEDQAEAGQRPKKTWWKKLLK